MLKRKKKTKTAADTKTEKPDILSAETENRFKKHADQNRKLRTSSPSSFNFLS